MVDCGVGYKEIEPFVNQLQIVLISHEHGDHLNIATIKKLAFERPSLRFGCGPWLSEKLDFIRNLDVYELNTVYDYGSFKLSMGKLYHDVENGFFRIEKDGYKIFRATDTAHLQGITAKNYDLYAIEHNYNEDTIDEMIEKHFYKKGAINTHLSEQQARQFIYENRKPESEILRLHESKVI